MAETAEGLKSYVADGAITRYTLVEQTGANTVGENVDGTANRTIGVAQNQADDGEHVSIKPLSYNGTTKLVVDGTTTTVNRGASLVASTGGRGIDQSTSGSIASAVALEEATSDGITIEAMLSLHQVA